MNLRFSCAVALLVFYGATFALAQTPPPRRPPPHRPPAGPGQEGGPLPGLTSAELADFRRGLATFRQVENIDSGLGPIFNDVSCVACHRNPSAGGTSRRSVTLFGHTDGTHFDPLVRLGGPTLQARSIDPSIREIIPREANTIAHRITPPLFGAGLIEAIPDSTFIALAATRQPDGVHGRVAVIIDITDITTGRRHAGRFGLKAQHATLLAFTADAFLNEMGITNRFFPKENAPNGNTALLARFDQIADPEDAPDPATGKSDVDRAADFMRLLAPPAPRHPDDPSAPAGARLFATINCTACHTPTLTTGPSPIAALAYHHVPLYSDLLLHDMGSLGDGIAQGAAGPNDMRTTPLWGLGSRQLYLHDGRTDSLDAAIKAHDGEAAISRDRYGHLSPTEQGQLLAFLRSL